jgi:ComF family protein
MENLGEELAELLYRTWLSDGERIEAQIIAPVPLHPVRLRERGYNQSCILAKKLHKKIQTRNPELIPLLLERTRDTPSQTKLSKDARIENLRGAFRVKDGAPPLNGRTVLLIDDVCTTGATFGACARALKDAGAKKVCALAIARD